MKLFIEGDITEKTLSYVLHRIADCPPEDDTIVVYINSGGGEDDYDYSIQEALRLCGKKIKTYAVHEVFSAAVTVYLAGDERYAHDHSRFMIHEVYHDTDNEHANKTVSYYKKSIEELQAATDSYYKMIAIRATKLTPTRIRNEVKKAPNGDWEFNTKDARKFGLVTHIGFPMCLAKPRETG